jgi:hypothetical protein
MPMGINELQAAFFGNNLSLQNYDAKVVNNNEWEGCFVRIMLRAVILIIG